ncbi:hypothetical protein ACFYW1_03655 [Streptomyces sp. NPDC002669]|uniref:hypothetical protein n=1 Tax=Streptomyces sp. NPDC002669 TaxID=3364658 RepID=UPI0036A34361
MAARPRRQGEPAVLRPTGPDGAARPEVFARITAFVAGRVAHEIVRAAVLRSPDRGAAEGGSLDCAGRPLAATDRASARSHPTGPTRST